MNWKGELKIKGNSNYILIIMKKEIKLLKKSIDNLIKELDEFKSALE